MRHVQFFKPRRWHDRLRLTDYVAQDRYVMVDCLQGAPYYGRPGALSKILMEKFKNRVPGLDSRAQIGEKL